MARRGDLQRGARAALIAERQRRGWSRADVARRAEPETTTQQIERLEKGNRTLDLEWLERLAPAFGVQPLALLPINDSSVPLRVADECFDELAKVIVGAIRARATGLSEAALSGFLREIFWTFGEHPDVRRDPAQARLAADLLGRRFFK